MVDTATLKGFVERAQTLSPKKNTFAIFNHELNQWDYFKIKIGQVKGLFLGLDMAPPLLKEGYVTYQNKLYLVNIGDVLRRRVNINGSNARIYGAESNGSTTNSNNTASTNTVGREPLINSDQPRPIEDLVNEFNEAANLAWEEQIGTLRYILDSKA